MAVMSRDNLGGGGVITPTTQTTQTAAKSGTGTSGSTSSASQVLAAPTIPTAISGSGTVGGGYVPFDYNAYAGSNIPAAPTFNYQTPTLANVGFTPRTMEQLRAEGAALYAPGYATQRDVLSQGLGREMEELQRSEGRLGGIYDERQRELEKAYTTQRVGVGEAATARGFGRSSYVVDALGQSYQSQQIDADRMLQEKQSRIEEIGSTRQRLTEAFNQSLNTLTSNEQNQITAYINELQRQEQYMLLDVQKFNADQSYRQAQLDQANQQLSYQSGLANWQAQLDTAMRQWEMQNKASGSQWQYDVAQAAQQAAQSSTAGGSSAGGTTARNILSGSPGAPTPLLGAPYPDYSMPGYTQYTQNTPTPSYMDLITGYAQKTGR